MRNKTILLIVPPLIALLLLWQSKEQAQQQATNPYLTEDQTPLVNDPARSTQPSEAEQRNLSTPSKKQNAPDFELTSADNKHSAIEQIRAIKEKTSLHEALIKEHETFTRYPSQNTRFTRNERDPISMMYETHERTNESQDKRDSITVWSDKKYILTGDDIHFYARVSTPEQQGIQTKFLAQLYFGEEYIVDTFALRDEAHGTIDGIYSHSLTSEQTQALDEGIYKLIIVSQHKDLAEAISFVVSPPLIKSTGEFRDTINNGELHIEAQVQVQESGRYYVRGTLYDIGNTSIGSAEYAEELGPGLHWVTLKYFGLLLHDHGEHGPYTLKHLELARAGVPMLRMPLNTPNFITEDYLLDQFNQQTFNQQQQLK